MEKWCYVNTSPTSKRHHPRTQGIRCLPAAWFSLPCCLLSYGAAKSPVPSCSNLSSPSSPPFPLLSFPVPLYSVFFLEWEFTVGLSTVHVKFFCTSSLINSALWKSWNFGFNGCHGESFHVSFTNPCPQWRNRNSSNLNKSHPDWLLVNYLCLLLHAG